VLLWSAIWIALNVFAGLTGFGAGAGVHLVAWQAHIGGYFAGLLLAGLFDAWRNRKRPIQGTA
jgi:membrane associated rhomboid family serine protease